MGEEGCIIVTYTYKVKGIKVLLKKISLKSWIEWVKTPLFLMPGILETIGIALFCRKSYTVIKKNGSKNRVYQSISPLLLLYQPFLSMLFFIIFMTGVPSTVHADQFNCSDATFHRVVRLDIADGAFEPDCSEMRLQWKPRIPILIRELHKAPSILRLSYLADVEQKGLVKKRMEKLKKEIGRQWNQSYGKYRLTIATKPFWRRGTQLTRR